MSTCLNITHPQLYLHDTPCTLTEIQNHFRDQMISDRYNGLEDLEGIHRHIRSIIFPLRCTRLTPLRFLENAPFSFERLPVSIQFRIWKKLIPSGELVHCLSRLDPCTPPFDCKPDKVFFPSRFDFGNADCCVATADKPSRYLDYLLVSKRWNYATAHLFYATNTFAFSSLGEFGRFCNGIGKARVGRLVNVELLWQGNLTPRQKKGVSLRKQPLAWFMHTSRLRTLAIHINESDKSRMRRPYEMLDEKDYFKDFAADDIDEDTLDIFGMEARRTAFQPNYRKNRSMRTVQGMDFIYQLRGMKWVRFYDTNSYGRCLIRDWSFSQDIGNVVRREKTNVATFEAEIENLEPLTGLTMFRPDDETMGFVARFYDDTLIEDTSINGSETSSSSSGYSSSGGYSTSGDSSDSGNSSISGGSARSASRSSTVESDVEVIDSDVEMGDASNAPEDIDQEPQDIDIADYLSSSSRSSRSNSIVSNVTPQPHIIIIEDGDANDKKRRRPCGGGETSSDSGLFVREGSCSAPSGQDGISGLS
ncbi:hypothetical protein GGS24DRAFT_515041 [Hypoxylon argillaceum]|nr:hypothetical protein GGS24DRAFT_515041 [Hypoxylon argillaceum]